VVEAEVEEIEEVENWRAPILEELKGGTIKAMRRFFEHGGILYKRSYAGPHLRCVTKEKGRYVLREMHEGCCSDHCKSEALVAKILRAGYFWPTMREDAKVMVKKCLQCQKHDPLIHQPAEAMMTMGASIPFAQWGIDLVGPMPQGTGQRKFLIVAVEYFTKW
ncbi:Unknown protein, partial [Striga hermonthica]